MKVILFDIDGTLLRGFGAGRLAFERAFRVVFGIHFSMDHYSFSGATDQKVFRDVARQVGRIPSAADLGKFFQALPAEMEHTLADRAMLPYPGIIDLLEVLSSRPDILLAVVTGNIQATARLKLQSGGVEKYFLNQAGPGSGHLVGGFGDDAVERNDIAATAKTRVIPLLNGTSLSQSPILIGDTPSDIAGAKAIQAVAVGVATGVHSVQDLQQAGADQAFANLSDTDRVLELLNI